MKTISETDNSVDISPASAGTDLLQLIHDDNKAVAELFFQFTQAEEDEEKQQLFDAINSGLTIHAQVVEEHLYPAVVDTADEEDREEAEKLVATAEAGNHVASLILDELTGADAGEDEFEAKMTILCELVKEQVKREEKDMFDKLRAANIDFDQLGEEAEEMKQGLKNKAQKSKSKTKAKAKPKNAKASLNGRGKANLKPKVKAKPNAKAKAKTSPKSTKKAASKKASKPAAKKASTTKKSSTAKSGSKQSTSKKPAARSKASTKASANKKRSK